MKSYNVRRLAASLNCEVLRMKDSGKFRWYVRNSYNYKYVLIGNDSKEAVETLEKLKAMRGYV